MSDNTTWIIAADGTYIKIMINNGQDKRLKILKDGDFEHTSELSYKLVTSKRRKASNQDEDKEYFLRLLTDFLTEQREKNAYDQLIILAPPGVLEELRHSLPPEVADCIRATVAEDHLHTSMDRLEARLEGILGN